MKKGLKKQLERELTSAIKKTLSNHNLPAVAKARKAIKDASKSVSKKFIKTLKAIAEKRKADTKTKKKSSQIVKSQKKVPFKKVHAKKKATAGPVKKKIAIQPKAALPVPLTENVAEQN